MDKPYDWHDEPEYIEMHKPSPIEGQMAFQSPFGNNEDEDKSLFFGQEAENNISSVFQDIIFKNPAYTMAELQALYYESLEMEDFDG